jgi:hypothetical protein
MVVFYTSLLEITAVPKEFKIHKKSLSAQNSIGSCVTDFLMHLGAMRMKKMQLLTSLGQGDIFLFTQKSKILPR